SSLGDTIHRIGQLLGGGVVRSALRCVLGSTAERFQVSTAPQAVPSTPKANSPIEAYANLVI
ncbi:MAG TPA: hypothetical protein VEV82_09325, partial [Actinomycetota bacterium]|nr:hypothetical protein [Actinomycetota bacterium]